MNPYMDDFTKRRQSEIRGYSQPITPFTVLHGHGREAVAGVALGALILIALMFFMAM